MQNNKENNLTKQADIEKKVKEMLPDEETLVILGHRLKRKHFPVLTEMVKNNPYYVEELIEGMRAKAGKDFPIGSLCAMFESDLD